MVQKSRPPSLLSLRFFTSQFLGPLTKVWGRAEGEEGRGGKAEGHVCCFCRQSPPGIVLNFHQVSSRMPNIQSGSHVFGRVCAAQRACLLGEHRNCVFWGAERRYLWETEPVFLRNSLSLCGTENQCLCGAENLGPVLL